MYHRFTNKGLIIGVTKETFEWQLNVIKNFFETERLSKYLTEESSKNNKKPTVIITVDDAYEDFYAIAYPLLSKYQIPATIFVATNYVNNRHWFWWDKIKFVIEEANLNEAVFSYNDAVFIIKTSTDSEKYAAWNMLSDYCLKIATSDQDTFIDALASFLNVLIPDTPIDEYKQMTWESIIEVSKNGVEIGSHTNNHIILTNLDRDQARREIELSKTILKEKTGFEIHTFSYPNGQQENYNLDLIAMVKKSGYIGAVVAHDGIFDSNKKYAIPRISFLNDKIDFLWKLYGMNFISFYLKLLMIKLKQNILGARIFL
jgi:peptidoglycan/xylan/chitin deacetylase (PgdA/CDA1 family)